ncbi:MAG: hypothetical protein K5707_05890 [Clostridia bacterium]|nr:hypothetical protein [Clostridia bacterium]
MRNPVTITLVALYFVLCIILGLFMEWWGKRKKETATAEGYTTARNTMTWLAVFGLILGNNISGTYILTFPNGVVNTNIGYIWPMIGYTIGYLLVIFFHRYYRSASFKYGASTIGQVFTSYFSARVAKVITITLFIAYGASAAAALGTFRVMFASLFGWGTGTSFVVTIALLVGLALLGGLGGLGRVNIVHVVFMLASPFIIGILAIRALPQGFGAAWSDFVAQGHATLTGGIYGPSYFLPMLLIQPFACFCSGLIITGAIGARSAKDGYIGQILMPTFTCILYAMLVIVGVCGMGLGIAADGSLWYNTAALFGPAATALACIGVLAGALSSSPPIFMMMGSTVVNEFILPMTKKQYTDKQKIRMTRIWIIICGIAFPSLGLLSTDLLMIISNAFSIWAVTGLALFLHLVWKRSDEKVMFWSMVIGAAVVTVWIFAGFFVPGGMLFGVPAQTMAFIVTVGVYVIMTLATCPPGKSENYLRYETAKREMLAAGKD